MESARTMFLFLWDGSANPVFQERFIPLLGARSMYLHREGGQTSILQLYNELALLDPARL